MESNIHKIIQYGYDTLTTELLKQHKSDRKIAKIYHNYILINQLVHLVF